MSLQCCTTDSNIKLFLHSKEGYLSEDLERLFWLLVPDLSSCLWTDTYTTSTKQNNWCTAECHKLTETEPYTKVNSFTAENKRVCRFQPKTTILSISLTKCLWNPYNCVMQFWLMHIQLNAIWFAMVNQNLSQIN